MAASTAETGYGSVLGDSITGELDLKVVYSGVEVKDGIELKPSQAASAPVVQIGKNAPLEKIKSTAYTLAMVDPDAPSPQNPVNREWLHWLVVNIPDDGNVQRGHVLCDYMGPKPPTGKHRYIFALYRQQDPKLQAPQQKERAKFDLKSFATNYELGQPLAATFFVAQPESHKSH